MTVEDILKDTSFTSAKKLNPETYTYTDKCLNCGKVWRGLSHDPMDNNVEKDINVL